MSRIIGTVRSSSWPAFSATATLFLARSPICWAAAWLRSASLRTSPATTANPLPCVPGPGRLDRRVQGRAGWSGRRCPRRPDLLGDLAHRGDGLVDGLAPRLGLGAGLVGGPGGVLGVLGVAGDRGVDRLQARGDLLERRRPARCAPCESCWALELSSLLAVETDAVVPRIWLMTSVSLSTTELTCSASSPSSSRR